MSRTIQDDEAIQRNLQELGRQTLNRLAGAASPSNRNYIPPDGDPLVHAESGRRTFDIANPPKSLTNPEGTAGGAFPALVYHADGRFRTVANQAELTKVRAEGFGLEPHSGFDYSHYHSLGPGVWLASTTGQAGRERYKAKEGRKVQIVNTGE